MRYALLVTGLLIVSSATAFAQGEITTTAEYVQKCGTPTSASDECTSTVAEAYSNHMLLVLHRGQNDVCSPQQRIDTPETVRATVQWLSQHPEYNDKDAIQGVTAALVAVYPCK